MVLLVGGLVYTNYSTNKEDVFVYKNSQDSLKKLEEHYQTLNEKHATLEGRHHELEVLPRTLTANYSKQAKRNDIDYTYFIKLSNCQDNRMTELSKVRGVLGFTKDHANFSYNSCVTVANN